MERAATRKELSHDRIVDAAARAIRKHGYAGVGVADVMRDAGLTHGGFYAHFASRDALLIEAIERAARSSAARIAEQAAKPRAPDVTPFRALVENYLSDRLLKMPDAGCPVAALCSEMPRQSPAVRKASAARVDGLLRYVARSLAPSVADQAGIVAATLVGSLQLARAIGDTSRGMDLLASARQALLAQYDRS